MKNKNEFMSQGEKEAAIMVDAAQRETPELIVPTSPQTNKEEILYCDRQNGSSGKDCKCVCHQEDYPLPKDFNQLKEIKIVPSPRIDYCGTCKKEHGYDCPKDKEEWEEEFADKFSVMLERSLYSAYEIEEVYEFINKLLLHTREEQLREIYEIIFKIESRGIGRGNPTQELRDYAKSKGITLTNE